ncbi:MAG: Flp pilus assembly complex ATPase component TadA [Candidatus Omnitrophica bacterium]|nr:Flp pilus assembly complex ATPase component TadA [Candidatus Omnitrophota bacterium]
MDEITGKQLGEILVERGIITRTQLEEALKEQKLTGQKIGDILVEKGLITQEELNGALAVQREVPTLDLSEYLIDAEVVKLIPEEIARTHKLMPVFLENNILTVAMANPFDVFVVDELQRRTGYVIQPALVNEMDIRRVHQQYYGTSEDLAELISSIDKKKLRQAENLEEETSVIKIVNQIIIQAIQERASDIHFEPEENVLGLRYRIDGMLVRKNPLPKELEGAIISRLKIMAGLDIAEKRLPQDGRILMRVSKREIDFRVSTCPTVHGENVVLRILDKSSLVVGLESLGFSSEDLQRFKDVITTPYGIVLVTGPTGSGKTTTLYSALQSLNKEDVNIMTIEDPVEYQFPHIRQVHVNLKAGLTFAKALRSFLRQDPDIIMVGEVRDMETAEIAVQAALTGHLVLSTLHTNDAPSAFTRLLEMGIEPFMVASSIIGVVAQRLIRRVCDNCKEEYTPSAETLKLLELEGKVSKTAKFVKAKGCKLCNHTGYKGRIGIFEILKNSPRIQELALHRASSFEIKQVGQEEGMKTLRESAIEKLLRGITTVENILRVT